MGDFMRFFKYIAVSIGVCFATSAMSASSITIITNNAHPISNAPHSARIINLDHAEELHQQLSLNLPSNPEQAAKIARSRLSTTTNSLQIALQDVVDAWTMGISKIPAVVVDNKVVYGVSDAQKAVALIESHQEPKP